MKQWYTNVTHQQALKTVIIVIHNNNSTRNNEKKFIIFCLHGGEKKV